MFGTLAAYFIIMVQFAQQSGVNMFDPRIAMTAAMENSTLHNLNVTSS